MDLPTRLWQIYANGHNFKYTVETKTDCKQLQLELKFIPRTGTDIT